MKLRTLFLRWKEKSEEFFEGMKEVFLFQVKSLAFFMMKEVFLWILSKLKISEKKFFEDFSSKAWWRFFSLKSLKCSRKSNFKSFQVEIFFFLYKNIVKLSSISKKIIKKSLKKSKRIKNTILSFHDFQIYSSCFKYFFSSSLNT